jgi:hypothetical protein
MSLIRSVNNDLKCGQFAPAGGGQFAPAEVVNINRQVVVSLLWLGLLFLSGLSNLREKKEYHDWARFAIMANLLQKFKKHNALYSSQKSLKT